MRFEARHGSLCAQLWNLRQSCTAFATSTYAASTTSATVVAVSTVAANSTSIAIATTTAATTVTTSSTAVAATSTVTVAIAVAATSAAAIATCVTVRDPASDASDRRAGKWLVQLRRSETEQPCPVHGVLYRVRDEHECALRAQYCCVWRSAVH